MAKELNTAEHPNTEANNPPVEGLDAHDVESNEAAAQEAKEKAQRSEKQDKIDQKNQEAAEALVPDLQGSKEKGDLNKPVDPKDIKLESEPKDEGYFSTKDTAYANLPKSDEEVTAGPYDPTVRDNTLNDDGTYEHSTNKNV